MSKNILAKIIYGYIVYIFWILFMKYILNIDKLQLGDIILESGNTKVVSSTIKNITRSHYSHAMLYIDRTIIHADGEGVYSKNPQRILVNNINDLKVLRCEMLSLEQKEKICFFARTKIGSLYSVAEATLSPLLGKTEKTASSREQFCSRLVAQAYYNGAGISLVKNPDYCSPADIEKSEFLGIVHNSVRLANSSEVKLEATADPVLEHQRSSIRFLSPCRKLFEKKNFDIQTFDDINKALAMYPNFDLEVCQYIRNSGYLDQYNFDRDENLYRYNSNIFVGRFRKKYNFNDDLVNFEMKINNIVFRQDINEYRKAKKVHDNLNLKYTKLILELYINLLLEVKTRFEVIAEASKILGKPDIAIECSEKADAIKELLATK